MQLDVRYRRHQPMPEWAASAFQFATEVGGTEHKYGVEDFLDAILARATPGVEDGKPSEATNGLHVPTSRVARHLPLTHDEGVRNG
jgi:hypothetical protein